MGSQLTLFNEKISDEQLIPIIMEIAFEIDDEGMMWNGKAHPNVSSGCSFGGAIPPIDDYKERIERIVASEILWFKESYGRVVKEKITITDKREKKCGIAKNVCAKYPSSKKKEVNICSKVIVTATTV